MSKHLRSQILAYLLFTQPQLSSPMSRTPYGALSQSQTTWPHVPQCSRYLAYLGLSSLFPCY
jgi:hypothetical protein